MDNGSGLREEEETQRDDGAMEAQPQATAMRKFEQHAHAPVWGKAPSMLQKVIKKSCHDRSAVERAKTVEEQCTAIIGITPWPFSVCWLCGFPVGQQKIQGQKPEDAPTMLQYIANKMGIQCVFINRLSKRYDRETCEHVNPINIAGTAMLNKGSNGYKNKHTLNIRMEYEGAHDFCNVLKNEGYMITLEDGAEGIQTFNRVTIADWQINAWPAFLLNGSMNGPTLSSVICFVLNGKKVFLKSPIHGYLLLKVLDLLPKNIWDNLFNALQPRDQSEALNTVTIVNGVVQVPGNNDVAAYFKDYIKARSPKVKKGSNEAIGSIGYIYDIRNITSIVSPVTQAATQSRNIVVLGVGFTYQQYIQQIMTFWYNAITKAMTVRMQKYVDFIKELDVAVDGLLWPLLTSSTGQTTAKYGEVELSYDELDKLLDKKLDELQEKRSPAYDLIAVPVQTMEKRIEAHKKYIEKYMIGPANTNLTSKKRLTQRDKLPQPVPGLPVCMSLDAYTTPYIFRFTELEKQKANEVEIAYGAVSKSLYNADFMRELELVVRTGQLKHIAQTGIISENDKTNPSVIADKLITTVEDIKCATTEPAQQVTGNNNSGSMSGVSQPATSRNSPSAASSASAALFKSQSRNVSRAVPVSFSSSFTTAPFGQQQMQPAAASSAPAALFRSQSNNFRYAVPVDMTAQKVTGKRKPINNGRGNNGRGNNGRGNNGVAMPISNNSNVRSVRPRYTARRTTNATPGGSHRNHRTRKQKKNRKTRKNKKLTKRF